MKHFRGASAHDERMHTFVMDYCFPSQGVVVNELKARAVAHIWSHQERSANTCLDGC